MTLEELKAEVRQLKATGANCSQCVVAMFEPELALAAAGLGGGVCGCGLTCGAASAMAIVAAARGYHSSADKMPVYTEVKPLIEEFKQRNDGKINCSDLRRPGAKPCMELINDAIEILYTHYAK